MFTFTTLLNYTVHHGALIKEQEVERAREFLAEMGRLGHETAPRGFGTFRHWWSGLTPQNRRALEAYYKGLAEAGEQDTSKYFVLIGNLAEAFFGEVMEQIGDDLGDEKRQ